MTTNNSLNIDKEGGIDGRVLSPTSKTNKCHVKLTNQELAHSFCRYTC